MPFAQPELYYIQSKPPVGPFLYHHAIYTSLKRIAIRWAIEAPAGKDVISLTTDAGRFLSPMPMFSFVTVDGVVKIPLTDEIKQVTVPALYHTHRKELVERARAKGYTVFAENEVPPEYRYIMKWVSHSDMFVNENEYTAIGKSLYLPGGSIMYIHPAKLNRFMKGLPDFAFKEIRSLKELAG